MTPDQWITIGAASLAVVTAAFALVTVVWHTDRTQKFTLGLMDRFHAKSYNEFMMGQMMHSASRGGNGMKIPDIVQPEDAVARMDREALTAAIERARVEAQRGETSEE